MWPFLEGPFPDNSLCSFSKIHFLPFVIRFLFFTLYSQTCVNRLHFLDKYPSSYLPTFFVRYYNLVIIGYSHVVIILNESSSLGT
jgi:hypothetical protein